MGKTFEDALGTLLDDYADTPLDEKISAFELALMALKEEYEAGNTEDD